MLTWNEGVEAFAGVINLTLYSSLNKGQTLPRDALMTVQQTSAKCINVMQGSQSTFNGIGRRGPSYAGEIWQVICQPQMN